MKTQIHKILKESITFPDSSLPKEERIEKIKSNYRELEELLPVIIRFLKLRFRDEISKIVVTNKRIYYGHEDYSSDSFLINVVFKNNKKPIPRFRTFTMINDFMGVNLNEYGVPMDIEYYNNENEFKDTMRHKKSIRESIRNILNKLN